MHRAASGPLVLGYYRAVLHGPKVRNDTISLTMDIRHCQSKFSDTIPQFENRTSGFIGKTVLNVVIASLSHLVVLYWF